MKKFWIIFSIIMAVLIGVNGFLFISNNFAMTTIISQNKEKIRSLTEDASIKLNKHDYFDITINNFYEYDNFYNSKDSITITCNLKLIKDDLDYIFLLSGVREEVEVAENETIETTYTYSAYYNKGDCYFNFLKNNEDYYKEKQENSIAEEVIGELLAYDFKKVFMDLDEIMPSDEPLNTSSSMVLTFKPFIFGQKFQYSMEDEWKTISYEFYVDVLGTLKRFVLNYLSDSYNKTIEITYNSFKKFTIVEPEGLETYMLP